MSDKSQVKKRVRKLRNRRRAAGLKRVEVLIPEEHVDVMKAYARQLREGSESERLAEVRKLVAKAYEQYHSSCLDNISIQPDAANFPDAAVIAAALIARGNSSAFKLGRKISKLAA